MALNSVIFEGKFAHFASKKGSMPLAFVVDNSGQKFTIVVKSQKMAETVIRKKPSNLRIVGSLERNGRQVYISAEHLDLS